MSAVSLVPAWFTVQTQDAVRWVPAIAPFSFVWNLLWCILPYLSQRCNTKLPHVVCEQNVNILYIVVFAFSVEVSIFCHNWLTLSSYSLTANVGDKPYFFEKCKNKKTAVENTSAGFYNIGFISSKALSSVESLRPSSPQKVKARMDFSADLSSPAWVRQLLYQSSTITTQRYIGVDPQRIDQAIEKQFILV